MLLIIWIMQFCIPRQYWHHTITFIDVIDNHCRSTENDFSFFYLISYCTMCFLQILPMPIVQVHLNGITYDKDNRIECYFAFSRELGLWLHYDRFFMFNPQEPHSLSLHCHKGDNDVHLISSYLKPKL